MQGCRGAWDGCNVTMPLKERILPLLDAVEPWTASCGAVNTVCFRNGRAVGYNTDGPGVVESLRLRGFAPAGQAALVLGAGGAAKAAALALAQAGCRVTVCARTPEKAAALAARCGGVTVSWEDLPRAAAEHGLLLNATPLGMEGSPEFESLDFVQALPAKAVVYDLVYHPTDTALMRAAEHRGLTAVGGLALLVQQAAGLQCLGHPASGIVDLGHLQQRIQGLAGRFAKARTGLDIVKVNEAACRLRLQGMTEGEHTEAGVVLPLQFQRRLGHIPALEIRRREAAARCRQKPRRNAQHRADITIKIRNLIHEKGLLSYVFMRISFPKNCKT